MNCHKNAASTKKTELEKVDFKEPDLLVLSNDVKTNFKQILTLYKVFRHINPSLIKISCV